jgi:transcription termination factor NusA
MAAHDLESLTGVGPATAQALAAAGFTDRQSVATATVEQLLAVRGFAEARATALIAAARSGESPQLDSPAEPTIQEEAQTEPERRKRGGKKRKKLRAQYVDLKKLSKKARKKSKTASSKKKRKRWAAEADRLEKKAKKAKKRLARQG